MKKSIGPVTRPTREKKSSGPSSQKPDLKKIGSPQESVEEKENKTISASLPQQVPEHEVRKQLLRPYLETDKRTYAGDPW